MVDPFLNIHKISKHFGGLTALNQVSLNIHKHQIKGLIGPNGAGKTTLFNLISGVFPVSTGDIYFKGKPINHLTSHKIAQKGIIRTFQNVKLFPNLTVLENVMVGGFSHSKTGLLADLMSLPATLKEEFTLKSKAFDWLQFVGLTDKASLYASSLPFGQQRLLEIARGLMAAPELLLLDEPAAGLSIPERTSLVKLIQKIQGMGITILLVEHDMDLVMKVCEEVVVLEFGTKIAEGTPTEIQNDRRVIAAYLGEEVANA